MSKKDKRQHHRVQYFGPAHISWDDEQGITRFAHAKCVNVSEGGLRIEVGEPIPVRSQISLRADRIGFSSPNKLGAERLASTAVRKAQFFAVHNTSWSAMLIARVPLSLVE